MNTDGFFNGTLGIAFDGDCRAFRVEAYNRTYVVFHVLPTCGVASAVDVGSIIMRGKGGSRD